MKKNKFNWNSVSIVAFDKLREVMITKPLLALPGFFTEFVVETYASEEGVGVVLMQKGNSIAYMSKALSVLSVYEKEMLAIVLALQK